MASGRPDYQGTSYVTAGNISISGTPNVSISGTPTITIESGTVITKGYTETGLEAYSQVQFPIALFDGFESSTIKWRAIEATLAIDSSNATDYVDSPVYEGDSCLKITGAANTSSSICRTVPLNVEAGNVYFSVYFLIGVDANLSQTDDSIVPFDIWFYLPNGFKSFGISYNQYTGEWFYFHHDLGDYTLIAVHDMDHCRIHSVKLALNFLTNKAENLVIDGVKYDLNVDIYSQSGFFDEPGMIVYVRFCTSPSWGTDFYIDNFEVSYRTV